MFFLQPLSSKQKAACHVQESSGKRDYRRFGSGETETDEFGVKEPLDSKENLSERCECFEEPGESSVGSELRFMRNNNQEPTTRSQEWQKDDTQTSSTRKLRGKFREHQETAAR